jgi:uncharacterized cupin superfamily protein
MPKIDIAQAEVRMSSPYPDEFQHVVRGREKQPLGNLAGLTQLGVNLTRLKPGAANGHHLVNRSGRDALYLEIGTRPPSDRVHYSDADLIYDKGERGFRFMRKSGEPYSARGA